ncbi:hypothetical protein [Sphingomonas sp. LR55]|uniref:hypothetical protein n=1 Tax=Sphingomonas sp. LR55 TaxID=3050231 RepID=UPI003FA73383
MKQEGDVDQQEEGEDVGVREGTHDPRAGAAGGGLEQGGQDRDDARRRDQHRQSLTADMRCPCQRQQRHRRIGQIVEENLQRLRRDRRSRCRDSRRHQHRCPYDQRRHDRAIGRAVDQSGIDGDRCGEADEQQVEQEARRQIQGADLHRDAGKDHVERGAQRDQREYPPRKRRQSSRDAERRFGDTIGTGLDHIHPLPRWHIEMFTLVQHHLRAT